MRQSDAEARGQIYSDLMSASGHDPKLFHKLIQHQRKTPDADTLELLDNGTLYTDIDNVLDIWTKHFSTLATPQQHPEFDDNIKDLVDENILLIEGKLHLQPEPADLVTREETFNAIRSLNLGRAKDVHGLKAEHLRHADLEVLDPLVNIFNSILSRGRSPD